MPYKTVMPSEGERFGRLTVLECMLRQRSDGRNRTVVRVRCDCGVEKEVFAFNLFSGNTSSCGCLHREGVSALMTKHGGKKENPRLYRIWRGMRERCGNPNAVNYRWYGGKGVKICKAWVDDFGAFRDWALDNGYEEGLEIDRKDSSKDYSPSNCQWITKSENIARARRGLSPALDKRLHRYVREHKVSVSEVIESALEAFLPE